MCEESLNPARSFQKDTKSACKTVRTSKKEANRLGQECAARKLLGERIDEGYAGLQKKNLYIFRVSIRN